MAEERDRVLPVSLALAAAAFAFAFRGRRWSFWLRMAAGVGTLGLFGLSREPRALDLPPKRSDLAAGAASAGLLYLVFQVGDRLARKVMPRGTQNIASIYELRRQAPRPLIALLLGLVIAPGEELFWRGFVQKRIAGRYREPIATPLAAALYSGVHVSAMNPTLIGAAGVAGLFWSLQYRLQRRLTPVLISHILWDIWIFLIAPTPGDPAHSGAE